MITKLNPNQVPLASGASGIFPPGTTTQYLRGDNTWQTFPSIPGITPSALTKSDDTNVTLTIGGTPAVSLLASVSLELGWTGTLADSRIASAAAWNAKQNALTNPITGTGSVNYIPKFNGTTALSNSPIITVGTNIGINTVSPANSFDVVRGASGSMGKGVYESASFEYNGDNKFGIYTSSANASDGASLLFGQTNLLVNSSYPFMELQYNYSSTLNSNKIRINSGLRNATGTETAATGDLFTVYYNGNVSVGAGTLTLPNSNVLTGNSGNVGFSGGISSAGVISSTNGIYLNGTPTNNGLIYISSTYYLGMNTQLTSNGDSGNLIKNTSSGSKAASTWALNNDIGKASEWYIYSSGYNSNHDGRTFWSPLFPQRSGQPAGAGEIQPNWVELAAFGGCAGMIITTYQVSAGVESPLLLGTGVCEHLRIGGTETDQVGYVTIGAIARIDSNVLSVNGLIGSGVPSTTAGGINLYNASNAYKTSIVSSTTTSDKTVTLPNITGTVALLSDLSTGYVPYTGATTDLNLGVHALGCGAVTSSGTLTLPNSNVLTGNGGSVGFSGGIGCGAITSSGLLGVTVGSGYAATFMGGNVGIGQAIPLAKLYVEGARNTWITELKGLNSTNVGEITGLKLKLGYAAEEDKWAGIAAVSEDIYAGYQGLALYTNTTEKVRIMWNGNVGIGTTSPLSKLSINGGLHVGGDSDAGDDNLLVDGTLTVAGAFGCNTKTAQTAYASGGAVTTNAGLFGFASDTERSNLSILVSNIRAALVANGIMS